jgi:hypothetical protein
MARNPVREWIESDPATLRKLIAVGKKFADEATSKADATLYRHYVTRMQKALDKFKK